MAAAHVRRPRRIQRRSESGARIARTIVAHSRDRSRAGDGVVTTEAARAGEPPTMSPSDRRQIEHADGRVELVDTSRVDTSPLSNRDLAPVSLEQRTWTTYNYAALWISMAHCIPTYMLASGLLAAGMNWLQALVTILLGNTIVLIPILLNSHPGTKYGIPFPVFARASYGVIGSNLPALMRAIVACGWFGIQTWIGGEALFTLIH